MKTTNLEIYNFLNLTSHRFGRIYKYVGFCPLPKNFVITKDKIKEKLILSQLQKNDIFPYFSSEEKNKIKKYFKNSLKNCKKISKINLNSKNFSEEFVEKLEIYFNMRTYLTRVVLKEFKRHTFDETSAYREIFNIDPVMSSFLSELFEEKVDFDLLFEDLESKYKLSYLQKLQMLEKKNTKRIQKQETAKRLSNLEKDKENSKKINKNVDKVTENNKKIENKKEIKKIKEKTKKPNTGKRNKEKE